MNPIPDRAKECLPPKKRESRQGSSEQQTPPDNFKPPPPIRTRPTAGRQLELRAPSKGPSVLSHYSKEFALPPPPAPAVDKFAMPWPLPSPLTMPYHYFANRTGERCGSKLGSWRDQCSPGTEPADTTLHHSRWQRAEVPVPLQPLPASTSYKAHLPLDSRDVWGYCNAEKVGYKQHFPRPAPYPEHHVDGRRGYQARKPNGLDSADIRGPTVSGLSTAGAYSYDGKVRQDGSHTNGKRRHPEEHRSASRALGKDSRTAEGPAAHSSAQDRDSCGTHKASTNALDKRSFPALSLRAPSLDSFSLTDPPGEAHIYYALRPVQPSLLQSPLAHPLQSCLSQAPAVPVYNPHAEDPHTGLRNSRLSPLAESRPLDSFPHTQYNSHGPERGQSPATLPCPRPPSRGHRLHSDASTPLCSSPGTLTPAPPPAAFLPHFTKGSLIELSGGQLRRVEELQTEDFLLCANTSPEFHLSFCTVLFISPCSTTPGFFNLQVHLADRNTQELLKVLAEYPFFVRDRGWSSCCPQRTTQLYGLRCRQLSVNDVCLALTPVPSAPATALASCTSDPGTGPGTAVLVAASEVSGGSKRRRVEMARPPPPPLLPLAPEPSPKATVVPSDPAPARKRHCSAPGFLTVRSPPDSAIVPEQREQQ